MTHPQCLRKDKRSSTSFRRRRENVICALDEAAMRGLLSQAAFYIKITERRKRHKRFSRLKLYGGCLA